MLDTERAIETPEGIELALRVAGPVPRALAWTLDTLIRFAIYIVLGIAFATLGALGMGLLLISIFLLEWFYPVTCEVYFDGLTPGKKLMGIKVVHDDGTPVGWSASMVRNLLRFADFLPLFYAFGLVSMLLNRDFKRLGDIAAGTRVVYREELPSPIRRPEIPPQAPPFKLTPQEQQALLGYAERGGALTTERARELAELAGPLVDGCGNPPERLVAIANWAAGSQ